MWPNDTYQCIACDESSLGVVDKRGATAAADCCTYSVPSCTLSCFNSCTASNHLYSKPLAQWRLLMASHVTCILALFLSDHGIDHGRLNLLQGCPESHRSATCSVFLLQITPLVPLQWRLRTGRGCSGKPRPWPQPSFRTPPSLLPLNPHKTQLQQQETHHQMT